MLKRLIFDIDDTLVMWKKEYDIAISKTLDELKFPHTPELCEKIDKLELEYEKDRKNFSRQDMLEFFNKNLEYSLPENFVDIWIKNLAYCVPDKIEKQDFETLEYLHNKYRLVILTNWFEESQKARLEKLNILEFFSEFYGAEKYAKPYKEAFIQAMGTNNPEECAMIGDNLESDIQAAKQAGISMLVWKDNYNQKDKYSKRLDGINVITKISDLRKIF